MKLFARIISYVFNPILVLICVPFLLLYRNTADLYSAFLWTLYTGAFLLAITIIMIYAVEKKIFTDMDVSKREQRPRLFLIGIGFALLYVIGLLVFHGPGVLFVVAFGITIGIILASIINIWLKASIHVATITALIFAVAIVYRGWYLVLLLLIPLVGWARVRINRHTIPETIAGGILGIVLSMGMYMLVKMFS